MRKRARTELFTLPPRARIPGSGVPTRLAAVRWQILISLTNIALVLALTPAAAIAAPAAPGTAAAYMASLPGYFLQARLARATPKPHIGAVEDWESWRGGLAGGIAVLAGGTKGWRVV